MTRREWLKAAGAAPAAAGMIAGGAMRGTSASIASLPDRAAFAPMSDLAYLDSGSVHPVPLAAKAAADTWLAARADPGRQRPAGGPDDARAKFARLVNADPADIAFVRSTTTAEHVVIDALGLGQGGGRIVTDTLHFFGSFPLYETLAARGADVAWLRPVDGRIRMADIERAVTPGTRLVSLSLVSTYNGFEHDLPRICEIAHARGAMVYADIVHAAGCVPLDLPASGVDFAACSSYKWLMGDFGLGFAYASPAARERAGRPRAGYYGVERFQSHVFPFDPPGERVADFAMRDDATGLFATGTFAQGTAMLLDRSLEYVLAIGVDRINAHARALTDRLKEALPRLGYSLATPIESRAPIVTCIHPHARALAPALEAAGVRISIGRHRFRATPSLFNTMDDIERLIATLAARH